MAESDDEYEIPLRDQRYFGSGLKRKRVHFVSSSQALQTTVPAASTSSTAAERYLSIVLGEKNHTDQAISPVGARETSEPGSNITDQDQDLEITHYATVNSDGRDIQEIICEVCKRPLTATEARASHERSIAHQVSLEHSHPPSHLDRSRKGLTVLQDHGWDPDSRLGLGARGEGIRDPIKAVDNPNRAGLGAKVLPAVVREKPTKLDAGKVRLMEQRGKKRAEMLRNAFYMSDDVQKYLGEAASVKGNDGLDLEAFKASKRRR